jgi:hypothetical protein
MPLFVNPRQTKAIRRMGKGLAREQVIPAVEFC